MFSRAGKSKIVKKANKIDKDANIASNYLDQKKKYGTGKDWNIKKAWCA